MKYCTDINAVENEETVAICTLIPRCPVILVLDTSHSMWGKGLADMKQSLHTFYKTVNAEGCLFSEIDIAAVSMGENLGMLEEFVPFSESQLPTINIRPKGDTPIGAALALAIKKIELQLNAYRQSGIRHVTPQLILLSDGRKSSDDITAIADGIRRACEAGALNCRAIAMGDSPDYAVLQQIAGNNITTPLYGDLRTAFAEVGRQVSSTYEDEARKIITHSVSEAVSTEYRQADVVEVAQEQSEYLLDGSNILHWGKEVNGISLQNVLAITRGLEQEGKPYSVYFDATARHILAQESPDEVPLFEKLLSERAEHFLQVPAGTRADDFMLFLANEVPNRVIMTNDCYKDHAEAYPWVREAGRLLHGMRLGNIIYFPEKSLKFSLDTSENVQKSAL